MNTNLNLNQQINHLYDQYACEIKQYAIYITREDGTNVFSNRENSQHQNSLVTASWQAIDEIRKVHNLFDNKTGHGFKLSFEISDQGVFVLCFKFMDQKYFASIIYKDILNPVLLKRKFQELILRLSQNLQVPSRIRDENNSKFLFQNISDDELDKVFSSLRGEHVIC